MKNNPLQEHQEIIAREIKTLENDFDSTPLFLTLYDFKEAKFKYFNPNFSFFCGLDEEIIYEKGQEIYKSIIHPDDQCKFIGDLNSWKKMAPGKTKESFIRMKNKENNWSSIFFTQRIYNWNPDHENPVILSFGREIKFSKQEELQFQKPPTSSSATLYRQLIGSLDEGFCIIEMIFDEQKQPVDYLFVETNPAFEEQIDLPNAKGRTMRELIPDHEDPWFENYGKIAVTGIPSRFQFLSEKLGNVWLDVYAFRVGDNNSRRVAILFRNITRRKHYEENLLKDKQNLESKAVDRQQELEENHDLLQAVFDNTNLGIAILQCIFDEHGEAKDFKYLRVNKVLKSMHGDKDMLGCTVLETSKYDVQFALFEALKDVMATGEPLDREIYFDKEGYNNWFRITARPQGDLLIASLEDISERKAKAQELEETIRFKRQLVRTSPETIMIINLNSFSVRYINKDIFPKSGMTREKIEGMPLAEILPYVHSRDREKLLELHKKLLKSSDDDIHDIELRLKLQGESWEWFSVRGKIFHRKDSTWVDEYVLLVRNIEEIKKTQKALLKAEKFSIQGEIARTLAHELRNPLASIGMATEVLGRKLEDSQKEELENYLQILSRSAKTLNSLVTNLLNSSNYSPAVLKRQDLAKILEKTIHQAGDRIYLSGIKVVKKFEGPYPIMADKEKLQIALLNIIVNASEATTPEKGIIEIEIKSHKTDFQLNIRDNGHGMEPEQIERLFEAFYSNKDTGVGVGLSSVKNVLEEHDAEVKVESEPGKGSCFKLFFHNADIK